MSRSNLPKGLEIENTDTLEHKPVNWRTTVINKKISSNVSSNFSKAGAQIVSNNIMQPTREKFSFQSNNIIPPYEKISLDNSPCNVPQIIMLTILIIRGEMSLSLLWLRNVIQLIN